MAIKKDMSKVAAAAHDNTGEPPDSEPRYGPALAQAWFDQIDQTPKPHAFDTRLRNSDAGKCTRQIQYAVIGADKTEPMTPAGYWVTGLGTIVHERWQEAMLKAWPEAEAEVKVRYEDFESSGHIDLVIPAKRQGDGAKLTPTVSLELKTINGWGFKQAVGARGAAQGPRHSHKLQCALNAVAADADEMVIVYLAMENISPAELKRLLGREPSFEWDDYRKFTAEWSYTREQFEPWAEAEMKRMTRVLEFTDDKQLVPRFEPEMPAGARIVDPSKGTWQQVKDGSIVAAGSTWMCNYCSWRSRCIEDGPSGSL